MKATVKQDFDYSHDGIRLVRLKAGETHAIRPDIFPGLLAAGLIAEEGAAPATSGSNGPKVKEAPQPAAIEPEAPAAINPPAEAIDALDALETAEQEAPMVRHIGRGKYSIFRGDERLTADAMTKEEAEAALANFGA